MPAGTSDWDLLTGELERVEFSVWDFDSYNEDDEDDNYDEDDEGDNYDEDDEDYEADEADEEAHGRGGDTAPSANGKSPDTNDKPSIEEEHPPTESSEKVPVSGAKRPGLTPPPEHGIHQWTLQVAWECRRAGYMPEEAIGKIMAFNGTMRRYFQPREVEDAVEKAFRTSVEDIPGGRKKSLPEWNPAETKRLAAEHPLSLDELVNRSGAIPSQYELLRSLFPDPDSLLCIGRSATNFRTDILDGQMNLETAQFIVPAIMTKRLGETDEGKLSAHSKDNTGPREFIVFDFDKPSSQEQLAAIGWLSKFRKPVLILHSGGKSFHVWFRASENPDDDETFWRLGITLGADPAIYNNRSSFVRLPKGCRENGVIQEVHYFDPHATSENLADIGGYLTSLNTGKEGKDSKDGKEGKHGNPGIKFFTPDDFDALEDDEPLVEGLLCGGSTSVVYGPSGCGKTFWVVDLAAHVATGKPWRGRRVRKGAVFYLSLEGRAGFKRRVKALRMRGVLDSGAEFYVTFDPVLLPQNAGDLVEAVKAMCDRHGVVPALVIVDTLARSMGGDENSGKDMAEVIAAVDQIRKMTGAQVLVVHHAGKDEGRGARGHSSLRAAVDTEIKVSKGADLCVAQVRKQRDLEEGPPMPFSISQVDLGASTTGRAVTSAVVIQEEHVVPSAPKRKGGEATPEALLDLLPVKSAREWVNKAEDVLGVGRSRFYELKKRLPESSFRQSGREFHRTEGTV